MSVTSGAVPGFSWAPDCSVGYLAVNDRGNRSVGLWSGSSPAVENIIQPPVSYGQVPDGASQDFGPELLMPDGAYLVTAYLVHRDASGALVSVKAGEAAFNH